MKEYGTENWIDFATLAQVDGATINVVRIKSAYEREFITKIRTEKLHYMHSLAQTQNYAILLAHPGYLNVMTLLKTTQAVDALQWDKNSPTYVYVVHLKTGGLLLSTICIAMKIVSMKTLSREALFYCRFIFS